MVLNLMLAVEHVFPLVLGVEQHLGQIILKTVRLLDNSFMMDFFIGLEVCLSIRLLFQKIMLV